MQWKGTFQKKLIGRIRANKKVFILYSVLRALVIATAVRSLLMKNYESMAICIFSLVLFLLPSFLEESFRVDIPPVFEGLIYLFIYAAEILGEVNHFYVAIPGWDTMLHTINGFLMAAVGFSMIDLLNRSGRDIHLSPVYLAMVAFCFSMTVGVFWEFIECAGDLFFGQDMQKDFIVKSFQSVTLDPKHDQNVIAVKNITDTLIRTASGKTYEIKGGYLDIGILDTMKDLFVNFIGAAAFSAFGYAYVKGQGKRQTRRAQIAGSLLVHSADEDPVRSDAEDPKA